MTAQRSQASRSVPAFLRAGSAAAFWIAVGLVPLSHGEEKSSAPPGGGATPVVHVEHPPSIRKLIELLGDDRFSVRNQASDELKSLGRAAIGPLAEAAAEDEPEIRTRAMQLLVEMRGRGFMGVQLEEY